MPRASGASPCVLQARPVYVATVVPIRPNSAGGVTRAPRKHRRNLSPWRASRQHGLRPPSTVIHGGRSGTHVGLRSLLPATTIGDYRPAQWSPPFFYSSYKLNPPPQM